jgi:hypothetical protein
VPIFASDIDVMELIHYLRAMTKNPVKFVKLALEIIARAGRSSTAH